MSDSPLLERENKVRASLLEIRCELQQRLLGEETDSKACRRQLRLLKKKKCDRLKKVLIGRFEPLGFCLGDDIEGFTGDLLNFAAIHSDPLIHDILTLIIRLVYRKGEPKNA